MSAAATVPRVRRPVTVTLAVVLICLDALLGAGLGILVLLSRYDVPPGDVFGTSLLGAAIILFALLVLAVGGGVSRASRGSRLTVTVYVVILLALQTVTVVITDAWDWFGLTEIVLEVLVVAALWLPPGSRYFHAAGVSDAVGAA